MGKIIHLVSGNWDSNPRPRSHESPLTKQEFISKLCRCVDVSPGLVVTGGDSCSKGHGFESQYHILDGHFSKLFVVKIVTFVWKDEKETRDGAFLVVLMRSIGTKRKNG